MALFIWLMAFDVTLAVAALVVCSLREEFLAATGILPETYLAPRPAPGFAAGSRRATTVVDRGMIVVSSSYSSRGEQEPLLQVEEWLTFASIFGIYGQIKVGTITETALQDDIAL